MSPRLRALVLASLVVAAAPLVGASSPAGAVDQDLVVSVAAGAPGDGIDVSSASCADDEDAGVLRFLSVRLISGTAPDEVLVGFGAGDGPTGVTVVVPDWADPTEPAVLEATCQELDFSGYDLVATETPYDPVAFDIEPGVDPAVQGRTFSRTELLVGQGFSVEATGCTLPDAAFGLVEVAAGEDLSGRTIGDLVTSGGQELLGGTEDFRAEALLVDGGTAWAASKYLDEPAVIDEVIEYPNPIEPGTYTALPYCTDGVGAFLSFEPQIIEATGTAPIADVDLVGDDASRTVELAGGSCTSGDVQASLDGRDIEEAFQEPLDGDASIAELPLPADVRRAALGGLAAGAVPTPALAPEAAEGTVSGEASMAAVLTRDDGTSRALADDGYLDEVVTPDGSGAWSLADTVGFDVGVVNGYALCGDPFGDGWYYDPQIVAVQAPAPEPAPLEPAPTGAVPIRADPTYTG